MDTLPMTVEINTADFLDMHMAEETKTPEKHDPFFGKLDEPIFGVMHVEEDQDMKGDDSMHVEPTEIPKIQTEEEKTVEPEISKLEKTHIETKAPEKEKVSEEDEYVLWSCLETNCTHADMIWQ